MTAFLKEIRSLSRREHLFILCAMLCGFLISAEYAVTRPVSNALFLTAYGASLLPYVWLAAVPLNFVCVAAYNKYLPRFGCFSLFLVLTGTVVAINEFSCLFLSRYSWLPFFFYLWKEIYIMLMFQQLWSVIHLTLPFSRAKYLYGLFFAVGALGAFLGSFIPGFFAVKMGSESLLVMTIPLYLALSFCYYSMLTYTEGGVGLKLGEEALRSSLGAFLHGCRLIFSSRYLLFILVSVVLMQLTSTLVDFQFNFLLEKAVPYKDLRTAYTGQILGIVHFVTILFQLVGSFLLIHYLGMKRSHLSIPLILGLNALAFQCFPLFALLSLSYISVKSCDFSLFSVLKELLYVPLSSDEKFRAKAVIDVFAHRSSKALASVLILGMQACLGAACQPWLGWSCVLLFSLWALAVMIFLKEPLIAQGRG